MKKDLIVGDGYTYLNVKGWLQSKELALEVDVMNFLEEEVEDLEELAAGVKTLWM